MIRFRQRAGHTLVEILLALGLSLVILAAAYAALDQHWRYANAGQQQTERLQVTRALFERLSLDLRSVVFQRDVSVSGSDGIVGDEKKLVLRIDTPSDDSAIGPQSVRWEMQKLESKQRDGTLRGLSRITGDTAVLEGQKVSPQDIMAAEVATIRFRYFARGSWFDDWHSADHQELPQAVEITIGFRDANAAQPQPVAETHAGEYRLVVPVPAAEA